jgi:hypothetical protein
VTVVGRAEADRREVELGEDGEGLQLGRALRPEAGLEELRAAEPQRRRRLDAGLEAREVLAREQAAPLARERRDLRGDLARVERPQRIGRAREVLEGPRERGVAHDGAHRGYPTLRQVELRARRPLRPEARLHRGDPEPVLVAQALRDGKAVPRQGERRRDHLGERQAAPAAEGRDERAERRRHPRGQDPAVGNVAEAAGPVRLGGRARGGCHVAVHRVDAPLARRADEERALAADGVHLRVHHALDERRGHRSVDRVAAGLQDVRARRRGQVAVRGDRAARSEEARVEGGGLGGQDAIGAPAHGAIKYSGPPERGDGALIADPRDSRASGPR